MAGTAPTRWLLSSIHPQCRAYLPFWSAKWYRSLRRCPYEATGANNLCPIHDGRGRI